MENIDNREKIINCALNLFNSRGYEGVSVNQITESAGITKPTLYYYFGSKYGLLEAVIKNIDDYMLEKIEKAAEYNGDVPVTLFRLAAAYFLIARSKPEYYRMQLSMVIAYPQSDTYKAIRPGFERQIGILEKLFFEASKNHGNMVDRHKAYAATFLGMLNTYIGLYLSGQCELNDEITFKAVHQFMHGIFS